MKFRLLDLLLLSALLLGACRQNTPNPDKKATETPSSTAASTETLPWAGDQDLVCEMKIDRSAEDTLHYNGKIYGFCGPHCKEKFQENPGKYASK